ncbi:uncharacterized protein [Phyllobates terribilis]|uniref:uncharacterized protein n=1 Tax=Phyllobates terribilis TaxID=111132 RepID=UPI003CCB361A
MSLPAIRSRLLRIDTASIHGRGRLLCTSSSIPKEPHLSSSSADINSAAAASSKLHESSGASPPPPPPASRSPLLKFLNFTLISAFTGAAATAGYATYAYTTDEVDEKTKTFRQSANYALPNDASAIDGSNLPGANKNCYSFWLQKSRASLRSTAVKASAGAIEFYLDTRRMIEERVRDFTEPSADKLLPDLLPEEQHVYTLVLDLSETLIHSDWKRERGWRTFKRPGLDAFLEHLSQFYEIVVYSDQMNTYVDDIVGRLNATKPNIRFVLSRAATKYQNGQHYRDFSKLNRDPSRIIYVSAHALENTLQPENSIPIKPWTPENMDDTALLDLIPFLEYVVVHRPPDIRQVIASYEGQDIAKGFLERTKENRRIKASRNIISSSPFIIVVAIDTATNFEHEI